jgi:dipeptidyl aminopeptidase/acylaminoacyl peptidase
MTRYLSWSAAVLTLVFANGGAPSAAGRPLTVADEIGLTQFGDPYTGQAEAIQFSPDAAYFAVHSERGRLDLNRPEDSLRIYRTQEVLSFLGGPRNSQPPTPIWAFNRSTDENGPIIMHWRWLADSSGIAYLERGPNGSNRLMLADLTRKSVEPLTPEGETVKGFDIRDRQHYVYAIADPGLREKAAAERGAAAIAGTGRTLSDLLFPVDQNPGASYADRSELWAVVDGQRSEVKNKSSGRPVVLYNEGQRKLALSPNGRSLVTALPLPEIPADWEALYPPPFTGYPYHLRAGRQDLQTFLGWRLASQYVRIDLLTGSVQSLTNAPTTSAAGWFEWPAPAWSSDGNAILIADTFVASASPAPSRPCVILLNLVAHSTSCIEQLKGLTAKGYEDGYRTIKEIRFEGPNKRKVVMSYYNVDGSQNSTEYQQTATGKWIAGKTTGTEVLGGGLEVTVKQGLNDPPVLMARDAQTKVSGVIWDPNPQLTDITLGEATVYKWKDNSGRGWKGGLFRPIPYHAGHRYPLVVQTHGFTETQFTPSGVFPTAFAARALAGAGLAVLQVSDCAVRSTPEEPRCNVEGYEAAVNELVKEGMVDHDRIGIVGFSRTCFYVMEMLTTSALHVKAAALTDGVMGDYLQYLMAVDMSADDAFAHEFDAIIGARPFGAGLQQWFKHSPLFNIDRVSAPLLVVGEGRPSLLYMWAPYAALRSLRKPTELVLLNSSEHVLTNPTVRLASQGGTVDWFRFWLQGYEDPAPAKTEQYRRWRGLRKLQEENDAKAKGATN